MRHHYTRVSASMRTGLGRGLREFGGYRATSTRRPMLLSISAISFAPPAQEYAVDVLVEGSDASPKKRKSAD